MHFLKRVSFLLISSLFLFSCGKEADELDLIVAPEFEVKYSFFAAGHTYGNPAVPSFGLYEPFMNAVPYINQNENIDFGALTGDIVIWSNIRRWDSVLFDLTKFIMPVKTIPGNHDRDYDFYNYIDSLGYSSFLHKGDLFIQLNPKQWTIKGDQLNFLRENIEQHKNNVNNIFIFVHELLWWSPKNSYNKITINYHGRYRDSTNYWTTVEPFLDSVRNDVYLIAGDVGGTDYSDPYMYHQDGNIHYVASGMGGAVADNFIIIDVLIDGSVRFNIMDIMSGEPINLGGFENYQLPN